MDPHIHVDAKLGADVRARELLSSTFGLVSDVPTTVSAGCGLRVGLAMTSARPEQVTCLPCREYAHDKHLALAAQAETLSRMAGSAITPEQGSEAAARHRQLAQRYRG